MDTSYNFRGKDPVIDVLRTLIQIRAEMEGIKFKKVLAAIERESNKGVTYTALVNWFYKDTRYPRHATVVRVANCLRMYCRRPIRLGDRTAFPVLRIVGKSKRRAA